MTDRATLEAIRELEALVYKVTGISDVVRALPDHLRTSPASIKARMEAQGE